MANGTKCPSVCPLNVTICLQDYLDSKNTSNLDPFFRNSSTALRQFSGVVTIIIIVLGVLGNSLTIAALVKCPKIRNMTAAFITSLCVSDLCFCILVMPFSTYRFLNGHNYFADGDVLCILFPLVNYLNVGVSLLSVAAISINRFIMIAHPSSYPRIYTRKTVAAMVALIWFFSFALLVPTLTKRWGKFGFNECLGVCSIVDDRHAKTALFLIGTLTPCLAIIFCYAGIFWVVRKSQSRVRGHGSAAAAGNGTGGSDWRLTKMILAIFLSFLVCYIPTTIIKVADKPGKNMPTDAHIISYVLIYMSACINPIIYVTMNRQYRDAYKSVLCCWQWQSDGRNNLNSVTDKCQGGALRTTVSNVSTATANQLATPCTNPNPYSTPAESSKQQQRLLRHSSPGTDQDDDIALSHLKL